MQKVLDFLERYVQWVAIAIAAAFLVYALMNYLPVVAKPVTVEFANETLGPGEVDPKIKDTADQLQNKIDTPVKVPLKVVNFADQIRATLAKSSKPTLLPRTLISMRSVDSATPIDEDTNNPNSPTNNKVNTLPKLPPAILEPAATTDFAQVTVPAAGAPAAAPVAAAVPGDPTAPPAAAPAPAPGNAAAGAAATDTTWVRVPFSIPAGNIARAFGDVNIPGNLSSTSFLRVELIREKQLPGNQWGPEELVDPLPMIAMPAQPAEGPQSLAAQQQYLSWATANQGPIVQPEFFTVVAGTDPRNVKVDDTDATLPGAPVAFDPETFPEAGKPGGDIELLPPDKKALVRAVRIRRAQEAQEQKKQRAPAPGGNPGRRSGGRGGEGGIPGLSAPGNPASGRSVVPFGRRSGVSPDHEASVVQPFQVRVGPGGAVMIPSPGNDPAVNGDAGLGVYPGAAASAGAATPIQISPLPQAPFDPAAVPGGIIQGWAYDVTAAADSTYRYRVRYKIKNPIFGVQNVANSAALIATFALVGEDPQGWTPPITIAPLTHVYLSALPTTGSTRVGFTVFRWQAGKRHRAQVVVGPGDSIGKQEADVDYRTHWTLVEVRRDSSANNAYALLMNADGALRKVDFDLDKTTPLFKKLNEEVDGPAQPSNPTATPGNGGATYPPPTTPARPAGGREGPAAGPSP